MTLPAFLHNYLILNLIISFSYCIIYLTLNSPLALHKLSRKQILTLARYTFFASLPVFLLILYLSPWFINNNHFNFQLQPIVIHASRILINNHSIAAIHSHLTMHTTTFFSYRKILDIYVFGFIFFLGKFIRDNYRIIKLLENSHQQRTINNVHVLFSEQISIPFCWAFFRKIFVVLPYALIDKNHELKLALTHELQHIRQKDAIWVYIIAAAKLICFINPLIYFWSKLFNYLQEFACDEAVILHKKVSPLAYGKCLLTIANTALQKDMIPSIATAMLHFPSRTTSTMLHRRITMLFEYKKLTKTKITTLITGTALTLCLTTAAYALTSTLPQGNLSLTQLNQLITQDNSNSLQITAIPETLATINAIRADQHARDYMHAALQRMAKYQPYISAELKKRNMPSDLLALPLTESGYQASVTSNVQAAGIWQFIPTTARNFGLSINASEDDRLNTQKETLAALQYLQNLHSQFKDWNLALIAYEVGEKHTQELINKTGARNAWELVRSPYASNDLKKYMPLLCASIIIMHNPGLVG